MKYNVVFHDLPAIIWELLLMVIGAVNVCCIVQYEAIQRRPFMQ